jgi:hypothetical protein
MLNLRKIPKDQVPRTQRLSLIAEKYKMQYKKLKTYYNNIWIKDMIEILVELIITNDIIY